MLDTEQMVWAVGSIAQLNRVPFAREVFLQAFVPPYGFEQLPHILSQLGLKVKARRSVSKLHTLKSPCLLSVGQSCSVEAQSFGAQDSETLSSNAAPAIGSDYVQNDEIRKHKVYLARAVLHDGGTPP